MMRLHIVIIILLFLTTDTQLIINGDFRLYSRVSKERRNFVDAVQERLIVTVQQRFQWLAVHVQDPKENAQD